MSEQQVKVYDFIVTYGHITSVQTQDLLDIKQRRARSILSDMVKKEVIVKVGSAQNTKYVLK